MAGRVATWVDRDVTPPLAARAVDDERDRLLHTVLDRPDDDEARLVYGD